LEEVEGEVGVGGEEAVGVGEGEANVGEGEGGEEGARFGDVGLLWILPHGVSELDFGVGAAQFPRPGDGERVERAPRGGEEGGKPTFQQPNIILSFQGLALRWGHAATVSAVRRISSSQSSSS